jgi:membrane-associated phospholipid phosphatase
MFRIDGLGLLASGGAAFLLFLGMYLLRERRNDLYWVVALAFVICVCVVFSRIFASLPY